MPEAAGRLTPPAVVDDAWFDAPLCRNCGAASSTPHCAQCGQKRARRFVLTDIGRETWERLRMFELKSVRTIGRLVRAPGGVPRDYVLGRRHGVMHPLALLVALVAVLLLMLAANRYFKTFDRTDADLGRMAERILAWANWSFTLGIFAIFAGSWTAFRRRLGYNAVEHAVLAIYVQCLILAAILVNMLPTLIWRDPAFVLAHKAASGWYLLIAKLAIVAIAYVQFFRLDLRRDWARLTVACLIYAGASWLLLRAYAAAILWLVSRT